MVLDCRCAVLVVSFGSRFPHVRQTSIVPIECEIAEALPGFVLRRAFTGEIRHVAEGMRVPTVPQALKELREEGYRRVLIQPLFLTRGEEFDQLLTQAAPFSADGFSLAVGAPLLGTAEDCAVLARALLDSLEPPRTDEALVLMGHGSLHRSNVEFLRLEQALQAAGHRDAFVGVMRGEPGLDRILAAVRQSTHVRTIHLHPLLMTAGMHAHRDLAGPGDASWRTRLEAAGYTVRCTLRGLGEYPAVRRLFVHHAWVAGVRAHFLCAMSGGGYAEAPDGGEIPLSFPNREAPL